MAITFNFSYTINNGANASVTNTSNAAQSSQHTIDHNHPLFLSTINVSEMPIITLQLKDSENYVL